MAQAYFRCGWEGSLYCGKGAGLQWVPAAKQMGLCGEKRKKKPSRKHDRRYLELFTPKYISETENSPLDKLLKELDITHQLISPKTPWHNGKAERSQRNDQRYFHDWEKFASVDELNGKLRKQLSLTGTSIDSPCSADLIFPTTIDGSPAANASAENTDTAKSITSIAVLINLYCVISEMLHKTN